MNWDEVILIIMQALFNFQADITCGCIFKDLQPREATFVIPSSVLVSIFSNISKKYMYWYFTLIKFLRDYLYFSQDSAKSEIRSNAKVIESNHNSFETGHYLFLTRIHG